MTEQATIPIHERCTLLQNYYRKGLLTTDIASSLYIIFDTCEACIRVYSTCLSGIYGGFPLKNKEKFERV